MSSEHPHLSDAEFLRRFENQSLQPEYFNHEGHLRLGWLYLSRMPLNLAIYKTCSGICAYAQSLGQAKKFNRTITVALLKIMANRMVKKPRERFEHFLFDNEDLLKDALSVLMEYYSEQRLFAEKARISEVPPDIKDIRVTEAFHPGFCTGDKGAR